MGKLGLEIGVYQEAPLIGGTFGEVSESLRLSFCVNSTFAISRTEIMPK